MATFPCQICLYQFNNYRALRDHIEEFESQERYYDQEYARCREHVLLTVEKSYRPGAPYVCQRCSEGFQRDDDLERHVEEYRSREQVLVARLMRCRLHICVSEASYARANENECPRQDCNQTCSDISNLKRHFQGHVECFEMCPECSEIFRFCDTFMRHLCTVKLGPRLQHRKKHARQITKREFERAIKLCEAVKCETGKRKHVNGPVPSSKRVKSRDPLLPSDPRPYNNGITDNDNVSSISNNNTTPLIAPNAIGPIVGGNNYRTTCPLANGDNFKDFVGNDRSNTPPLFNYDDDIGAFFAADSQNHMARILDEDSGIGEFFAAGNSNHTADLDNDNDIGPFFAASNNNNAVRLFTNDADMGIFFAANERNMSTASSMFHY